MFPSYSISTTTEIASGALPVTYTLLSTTSPYTIVGVRMQQEKDLSETVLRCMSNGTNIVVAHNYAKDYPLDIVNIRCTGNAVITKTGTDVAFMSMTYIPDSAIPVIAVSTNTPMYINGFSYGEVITGFFLLILVTGMFFGGILNRVIGVKQKALHRFIVKL